jgi:hypothetical protein
MYNLENKKYSALTNVELTKILGGGKWTVISRDAKMLCVDENGFIHYTVRTMEEKYDNRGNAYNPPKIRNDK